LTKVHNLSTLKFLTLPIPIQKLSRKKHPQLQSDPIKETKYKKRDKANQINQTLHKMKTRPKTA
jgi:hypothetical protein